MPPSAVPKGLPSEPSTTMANEVTVASAPKAGVTEPNMKGANTPATAASPRPMPNAAADTRSTSMPVASASSRRDITARVSVPNRDQAHGGSGHPGRGKTLSENLDRPCRARLAAEPVDLDRGEDSAEQPA